MSHKEWVDRKRRKRKAEPPVCTVTEKPCSMCREIKPVAAFGPSIMSQYGLHVHCRKCLAAYRHQLMVKANGKKWAAMLVYYARGRAKKYGQPAPTITEADVLAIHERQGGLCYWYGIPLMPTAANNHPQKPSLDRLHGPQGMYTPDDCVLACLAANRGRSDMTPEAFRFFCDTLLRKEAAR